MRWPNVKSELPQYLATYEDLDYTLKEIDPDLIIRRKIGVWQVVHKKFGTIGGCPQPPFTIEDECVGESILNQGIRPFIVKVIREILRKGWVNHGSKLEFKLGKRLPQRLVQEILRDIPNGNFI